MAKLDTDRSSPSAKRKLEDSDSDSDVGPQLPSAKQDAPAKRAKTIGPAMPPPGMIPQADDSSSSSSDEDDDDDDDYGPSLPPPAGATQTATSTPSGPTTSAEPSVSSSTTSKVARDDWMLRPPDELGLSSRVDPTKLRNRKFNTAPSGRSGGGGGASGPSKMWTETPDEKRRRLENEVMGIQAPAATVAADATGAGRTKVMSEEEVKRAKMVQEYNDKRRSKSLYAQHKEGKKGEDEKDDPSARAFDKEKDIRAPSKITNAQRREMVNKASNFSSRFSGGNFL